MEEEFPFEALFPQLQRSVFEKFTYKEFAIFDEISNTTHKLCNLNADRKFPFQVEDVTLYNGVLFFGDTVIDLEKEIFAKIHAKRVILRSPITDQATYFLIKIMKSSDIVDFSCDDSDIPQYLEILKTAKPAELFLQDKRFFQCDFPDGIEHIWVTDSSNITLEEMFKIKSTAIVWFKNANFTAAQLREFLKLLQSGLFKCRATDYRFNLMQTFSIHAFLDESTQLSLESRADFEKGGKIVHRLLLKKENNFEKGILVRCFSAENATDLLSIKEVDLKDIAEKVVVSRKRKHD